MFENLFNAVEMHLESGPCPDQVDQCINFCRDDLESFAARYESRKGDPLFGFMDQAREAMETIRTHIFSKYGFEPDIRRAMETLEYVEEIIQRVDNYDVTSDREITPEETEKFYLNLLERIPEEKFFTHNLSQLVKLVDQVESGESPVEDLAEQIQCQRENLKNAWLTTDQLEDSADSPLEELQGSAILEQGLDLWSEALDCLEQYCCSRDSTSREDGIEILEEANQMLVTVQHLAGNTRS